MNKIFCKNSFNRAVCLVLTLFFLTSFPAGAAALALCLDEEENHIVDQKPNLADCHSSVEADLFLSDEHCSALTEKKNNDCVDVSLTNANALNRPSKLFLPVYAKVILTFVLPDSRIGLQQQNTGNNSSTFPPLLITSTFLETHRTVVLLI